MKNPERSCILQKSVKIVYYLNYYQLYKLYYKNNIYFNKSFISTYTKENTMQQTTIPLTDEEQVNMQFLKITDGIVTEVTDSDKLKGSLVLSDSTTKIGFGAFQNCSSLNRVVIPKRVPLILSKAFADCSCLTELVVDSENPVYCSENNIIYTKDKKKLITAAVDLTSVVIPDGVTEICDWAFSDCTALTDITIPRTVTEITDEVFFWFGLIHIVIPDTVIKIGQNAFSDCSALTSIVIPDSVIEIDDRVFHGCTNLKTVIIESAIIKHIGVTAFENVHTDVHFTVKIDDVSMYSKELQ